jgi:hypothetical protein
MYNYVQSCTPAALRYNKKLIEHHVKIEPQLPSGRQTVRGWGFSLSSVSQRLPILYMVLLGLFWLYISD